MLIVSCIIKNRQTEMKEDMTDHFDLILMVKSYLIAFSISFGNLVLKTVSKFWVDHIKFESTSDMHFGKAWLITASVV